jgi:hypothetical protein
MNTLYNQPEYYENEENSSCMNCFNIPDDLFINNFAPIEPYTILNTSFKTTITLNEITDLLNQMLSSDKNILLFTYCHLNSQWIIKDEFNNEFQINIYRCKYNNLIHIIEFQRGSECDEFIMYASFLKIKQEIENYVNMEKVIENNLIKQLCLDN